MRWQGRANADAADGANRPRCRIWELWTVEHQLLDKNCVRVCLYNRQIHTCTLILLGMISLTRRLHQFCVYMYSACTYRTLISVSFLILAIVLNSDRILKPGTYHSPMRPPSLPLDMFAPFSGDQPGDRPVTPVHPLRRVFRTWTLNPFTLVCP